MKQVININFHGRVIPIEVTAFDLLKQYTESLSKYFANEEGKEEIINDIENRIAELFQERLKSGAACITDDDVNAIIKSMGRPEEFESEEPTATQPKSFQTTSAATKRLYRDENDKVLGGVCAGLANYFDIDPIIVRVAFLIILFAFGTGLLAYIILWIVVPSTSTTEIGGTRKRLFRDPDNKLIAGICSGFSNYFGISTWIPRLLFLLPFISFALHFNRWNFIGPSHFFGFSFSPGVLIIYIILWLVIPEATTTAEKLEMKGEKVDMNSIKNSITGEMKDAKSFAAEKGKAITSDIKAASKRSVSSLGDIIGLVVKVFGYFILGCIGFAFVMALFGIGIASITIFPFKDLLIKDGWQNIFAWGTLLFFIGVPVIGIITWIIRRVAKIKSNRTIIRFSFFGLWLVGIFCFVALIVSIVNDFRSSNRKMEQEITLINPIVNKLEVTSVEPTNKLYDTKFYGDFFDNINQDTSYLKNIKVEIVKSPNDSFRIVMTKSARGFNKNDADISAQNIQFNITQKDSLLLIDKGIAITRKDKFRDQQITLTIFVPIGKQIRIDKNVGCGDNCHFGNNWDNDNIEIDNADWDENTDYIMQPDGLYTLDGHPVDNSRHYNHPKVIIDDNGVKINTL
jgi:phage shock protein PspC (stress-responsive transcriptional regulator)